MYIRIVIFHVIALILFPHVGHTRSLVSESLSAEFDSTEHYRCVESINSISIAVNPDGCPGLATEPISTLPWPRHIQ